MPLRKRKAKEPVRFEKMKSAGRSLAIKSFYKFGYKYILARKSDSLVFKHGVKFIRRGTEVSIGVIFLFVSSRFHNNSIISG